MRVLYVNQTSQVGGAEHSLLLLLQGAAGEVDPIVACPDGELADAVRDLGIEHVPIVGTQASFRLHPLHTTQGIFNILRSSLQVRRLVSRHSPDLVHANSARGSLLAVLARHRSGPPVVAHVRDWVPGGRFPRVVLEVIARGADAVVANSAYIGKQFDGLPLRRPLRVIYNPVDLERFHPESADGASVRRRLEVSPETVVLAVVGNITPLKGQDDAIRVLAALLADGFDVVLLLVGSVKFAGAGTQLDNVAFERRLHQLVSEFELEDRVRFLGERSDVPSVLAASDILLMPYWREGFGRVAVEAMAMGVPVAAASVGGPKEIVRHGVDGMLLPPRDPIAWARELTPLVSEKEMRERMGREGTSRARDFALDVHVAATVALYRDLLPEVA